MSGPKDDETTPDAAPAAPAPSPPVGATAATPDAPAGETSAASMSETSAASASETPAASVSETPPASARQEPDTSVSETSAASASAPSPAFAAPPAEHPPTAPPAASALFPQAALEPPSPDVAPVEAESALPGMHRGGFERWPTAPVGVMPIPSAPDLDAPVQWAAVEPTAPTRGMAAWALGFAIAALVVSLFVGWGFPIGLVAIVTAIIALRRPLESRAVAVWALVLGTVSVLYSAGWLLFAASRTDLLG